MQIGRVRWYAGTILVFALALARAGAGTLAGPPLGEGVRAVRMFHDDGAGRAGAEAPDLTFPTTAGRVHILVELAQVLHEPTEVHWTVRELSGPGGGVPLMERSSRASGFESLTFNAQRTPDWKAGRYSIDLAFDGKLAQSTEFAVVRDPVTLRVETIGLHRSDDGGQIGAPVSWFHRTDHRIFLRLVTSGCGGVPLRANLLPLEAGSTGSPVATFEEPGLPDASRNVDLIFETQEDWLPGTYRVEATAGEQALASIDLKIE